MLVRDTVRQQRDAATEQLESYEDRVNRYTVETLNRGIVLVPELNDTSLNPYRQAGQSLRFRDFEKLVDALSPRVATSVHPNNPLRGVVWALMSGGREYVTAYDRELIPELSVFRGRWQWEADPEYRWKTIDRADLRGPKPVTLQDADDLIKSLGMTKALEELAKRNADADPNVRPGQRRVLKKAGEAIRGWRTHLIKILQFGACTLGDIERVLPLFKLNVHIDNAAWAAWTGRQKVDVRL